MASTPHATSLHPSNPHITVLCCVARYENSPFRLLEALLQCDVKCGYVRQVAMPLGTWGSRKNVTSDINIFMLQIVISRAASGASIGKQVIQPLPLFDQPAPLPYPSTPVSFIPPPALTLTGTRVIFCDKMVRNPLPRAQVRGHHCLS